MTIKDIEKRFGICLDGMLWPQSVLAEKTMAELEYFYDTLHDMSKKYSCVNIIELGTRTFDMAYILDQFLVSIDKKHERDVFNSRIFCVDWWEGFKGDRGTDATADQIWKSIAPRLNFCVPIQANAIDDKDVDVAKTYIFEKMDNDKFAKLNPDKNSKVVNMVFVDIFHSYDDTAACIDKWIDCVSDGGVMVCHDIYSHKGEVDRAVSDKFKAYSVPDALSPAGYAVCKKKNYKIIQA